MTANAENFPQVGTARESEASGLITSDSDFEQAAQEAGYNSIAKPAARSGDPLNLKKDVSKTFKKMLTANHNRTPLSETKGRPESLNSTKYGMSNVRVDVENQT